MICFKNRFQKNTLLNFISGKYIKKYGNKIGCDRPELKKI